jgi:hypothetical protein
MPSRQRQPIRVELSNEERSVVCRGHGETGRAAFIIASRQTNLREVGIKSLVLSPCLCKNNNGIVKAYLRVPLDVSGLRLGPRPSPALVGQPSLGRVPFPHLLMPYSMVGLSTNLPSIFYPATMR